MSRKDLEPIERDTVPLTVEAITECPHCHLEFEVVFEAEDGVFETEDLEDPLEQQVTCPDCGTSFMARYEGWVLHGDAG